MDKKEEQLIVDGYRFGTVADAEAARAEEKKIGNLEEHLDYRKPQNVLLVYNKAIENRVFLTPVGLAYLHKMQDQMVKWGVPKEKIKPIPLYGTFSNKTENNSSVRRSIASRESKVEFKGRFVISVWINVMFALALAALIFLSVRSDVPNIINYKTAVINAYSEWEQELTQREKAVREAERKLDMNQE